MSKINSNQKSLLENEVRSSPHKLVIQDHTIVEYLLDQLKSSGLVRLKSPIASPDDDKRRNLASTNPTFAITSDEIVYYLIRCWGTEGTKLQFGENSSQKPTWKFERNEGNSAVWLGKGRRENPFSLEEISEEPAIRVNPSAIELDVEDARASPIGNTGWYGIFITVTQADRKPAGEELIGFRPVLYLTKDFNKFERLPGNHCSGLWKYTKDWVLFAEQVIGPKGELAYAALFSTRVPEEFKHDQELGRYHQKTSGLWIAYSKNLIEWYGHREILKPASEESQLGPGSTPIKTKDGWLHFDHAVKIEEPAEKGIRYISLDDHLAKSEDERRKTTRVYTPQAVLLNIDRPANCLSITEDLAQPKSWEISSKVNLKHLMITQAMNCMLVNGDITQVYAAVYGAADEKTGALFMKPDYVMGSMNKVPEERIPIPKP